MTLDMKARLTQRLARMGFRQVIRMMRSNPEENLGRMLSIARQFAREPGHKEAIEVFSERVRGDDRAMRKIRMMFRDPHIAEKFFINFILSSTLLTAPRRRRRAEQGMQSPTTLQIDPTSACNLRCPGCWAGEYQQSDRIEPDRLNRLLEEMKELDMYFVVLSGGEPFLYPHLMDLVQEHDDMFFMAYTNGTRIDEGMADAMAEAGNITPAFSLEGRREVTDARRGEGVYDEVMAAMDRCAQRGIPFGSSLTATRENVEEIYSHDFISMLDEKGVSYMWVFHYIPIGRDPDLDMMITPEQRLWMVDRTDELRKTYPIAIVDFWNDGHLIDGCIAGGRVYAHITAAGDVEPCGFVHYSLDNINEVSLKRALQSPLFRGFAERQPFSDNLLAPCPFIDNPAALRDIVRESNAEETHAGAADSLAGDAAEYLDEQSETWHGLSRPKAEEKSEKFRRARERRDIAE